MLLIPVIVSGDSGIIVGRHSGSSWAVRRGLMLAAECLLLRSIGRQGFFALAHGFTLEFEMVGGDQEAIQQGLSHLVGSSPKSACRWAMGSWLVSRAERRR